MSSVIEIESAIKKLSSGELDELSRWLKNHSAQLFTRKKAKLEALRSTAGCLSDSSGEAFEKAVNLAANQLDPHDW